MVDGTSYSAGNLEFVVQEISDKTISKLDLLQGKLQTMLNTLSKVSSLTKDLGTTVGRASGRSSGSKAGGGASSDYTKVSQRLVAGKTKVYAQAITVTKKVGNETTKLTRYYNEQGQEIQKLNKNLDENAKKSKSSQMSALSLARLFNKIYFLRNYTKQMFASMKSILDNAVDYTETLNLWQVAMRGNTREAENFVKTMNKAYGIATQTLMEYQAIFKNMLSSLGGLTSDTSYALSEYLTQMAIDYASLYNVSIERAMTTFQSVLSGQVRPIRSIAGYDITETTIYQLYQQLGGTKTMRQLSQTEKRLLRIYAVFQQMESSGAIGDLGKTMQSTANQMRMFTEQTKEFGTWVGLMFESWIRPYLPYMNAFMITLTNIAKAYAQLNGIKPQEFGVVESMEQLDEVMDKVEGKLLSFDRFESLNSDSDNNILGIDDKVLKSMMQYDSVLSSVDGEAQALAEQWTKLFVKFDEDGNIVGFTDKLKDILDTIKSIGVAIGILIGYSLVAKIGKIAGALFSLTGVLNLVKGAIVLGIAYAIIKLIENWDEMSFTMKVVSIGLVALGSTFLLVAGMIKAGMLTISGGAIALGVVLGVGLIAGLVALIIENWKAISSFFSNLWKVMANGFASVINGIANRFIDFINGIILGINTLLGIINPIIKLFGGEPLSIQLVDRANWKPYEEAYQPKLSKNDHMVSGFKGSLVLGGSPQYMSSSNSDKTANVYLDGKKVGIYTSKYSHNENVRTGRVRATI